MNRHDFLKLIAGWGVSVGFTAVVFGPLGFGLRYTDQLERRARSALEARQFDQVDVAVVRDPVLQRNLVLSGPLDPRQQQAAVDVVRSVPGAADVRWASGGRSVNGTTGLSARF